jgi:hypothetical protein
LETQEPNTPGADALPNEPATGKPSGYRAKDPLAQIADALREITPVLDAADMEPDPGRTDWGRARGQIDAASGLYKGEILPAIDDAFASIPSGSDLRLKVGANVAWIGAELASLLHASKRTDDAQRLLLHISRFAPAAAPDGTNIKAEVEGAMADTAAWVELMRGRYLQRSRQWDEGDRVLRAAKGKATHPTIKAAIAKQLGGARPITSVPPLFRINGCGASIYGERDRRPDGSYVTTYCVALLFIPVWPISAYRVIDQGNGSYSFLAREQLSGFARGYRWVLAGLAAVWFAVAGVESYLNDPHRLAGNAFAETRDQVASMEPARALDAWQSLANLHGYSLSTEQRDTTGREMVRLVLESVPSPMTAARVGEVETALARYRALPELAHGPAEERMVLDRVLAWQTDVGAASEDDALASLRVLDALTTSDRPATGVDGTLRDVDALLYGTSRTSSLFASAPELAERRASLHRAIAEQLAAEWPLEAIDHWSEAGDAASMERLGQALAELSSSRSLLLEVRDPASRYLAATSAGSSPRDEVALAIDAANTMERDEARRLALESGEARALEAVLDSYPGDQETIAALAQSKRQAGDLAGAHRLLDPLGAPGRLTGAAQAARASLLADEGHLDEAAALLAHTVNARLPAFQSAQRAYRSAFDARTAELEAQLRSPYPPAELEQRTMGIYDDAQIREIVQSWFLEQITADSNLASLRGGVEARSSVVPSVLQLAMLELRLGNDTAGEAREQHLREAERLFLAIREEVEGLPSFHLGLGQVYHRLGRAAEGDAEIAQVLAMGDPMLELEAAHTYRDLGLLTRATELAQGVYDRGVSPQRENAAMLMSLLSTTLEDEELWLSRADQQSDFVQINLLQARARRVARDGDLRQAERLFGQVADRYLAMSSHDDAALNNAAIAFEQRYECSGNPAHLSRSVELLEQALRRAPESGIAAGNLAEILSYAGEVTVLDRFVHARELHLDSASATDLVHWLLGGSQREAVLAALREEPRLRRAVEVARQAQTLSPQRTSGYDTERELLELFEDSAAIAALADRLSHVSNLETTVAAEQAARWQRGELDATMGPVYETNLATLRAQVESLRGGHAPTLAGALVLYARRLEDRSQISRDVADFQAAETAFAEAETAAPGWGAAPRRGWALIGRALLELASSDAAAQTIVTDGWRSAPMGVLCLRLANDTSAREAARRSATLREGVELLRGERVYGLQTLGCAHLAGDEALEAEARTHTSTERARRAFDAERATAPWSPYAELATLRGS